MSDCGAELYLDLLKRCLLNLIYEDPSVRIPFDDSPAPVSQDALIPFDRQKRLDGQDWPSMAHTMIGLRRLDNIQVLVKDILRTETPGDLIETGVWRGGSTIFMRGLLKAYNATDRTVWVADSFQGFPDPHQKGVSAKTYSSPELAGFRSSSTSPTAQRSFERLMRRTSYTAVREHFARYDLLDEHVQFLPGWFHDTLPSAPITRLALLRLDGDLYDSTYDALQALYPKLSIGGYVIVDDYSTFAECRQAVHDYLTANNCEVDLQSIDDESVFWHKHS